MLPHKPAQIALVKPVNRQQQNMLGLRLSALTVVVWTAR
jgi:hypothetical protein